MLIMNGRYVFIRLSFTIGWTKWTGKVKLVKMLLNGTIDRCSQL